MKALNSIKIFGASILGSLMLVSLGTHAQEEYDDMYFNPKDRKEVKSESVFTSSRQANDKSGDVINPSYSSQDYGDLDESYSQKNVNPEYIERYKTSSKESDAETMEEDSYYVEDYDRAEMPDEATERAVRNYNYNYFGPNYGFNNPWSRNYHRSAFYDPFWDPFYGYDYYGSPYRYGSGFNWNLSFSYGSMWGYNPWSYNPYSSWGHYDPWYGYGYSYSPFYSPYRSYYRHGFYSGYSSGFHSGFYSGYYGSRDLGYAQSYDYTTRVRRGANNVNVSENNNTPPRRVAVSQNRITSSDDQNLNERARTERDYSRVQNEYYNRSRSGYNDRSTENVNTNTRSGNTVNTTSTPRVRSSRSTTTDYARPSYRNNTSDTRSRSGSSYNNSTQRRSSYNRSNSNYQQRSRSTNSYSTPSRSSSSYSSGSNSRSTYSTPSRSSSSGSSGSSSGSSRSRR